MKNFYFSGLILLFFVFPKSLFSQADILPILTNLKTTDEEKIAVYSRFLDQNITKNFDSSLLVANEAIALAKKKKDVLNEAEFLRQKGNIYYFKGNLGEAGNYYYQSLKLLKSKKTKETGRLYNDLGRFYRKLKEFPRALHFYDAAFSVYSELNDEEGLAVIYNESGVVYEYMENYDEAIARYKKSLEIQRKRNDVVGQGYALEFIGGALMLQKKYKESEDYLTQALAIRKAGNDNFATALNYNVLANLYTLQHSLDNAEKMFLESNRIAQRLGYLDLMSQNYQQLATVYEKQRRFQEAYQYFGNFKKINDSIFNLGKSKQIEELSVKYETAEKDREILAHKNELFKRNVGIFSLTGLFITGLGVAFSLFRHRKKNEKIKLQKEILHQQDLATKAVLNAEDNERKRMATHLHDGVAQLLGAANMNVGVLEDFREDTEAFGTILQKTQNILSDAIADVRSLSHQMMPHMLIKNSLGNALRDLVEKSDSPKLHINLKIENLDENLDANIQVAMYRIIQECINNTMKHAEADEINIFVKQSETVLLVSIQDNGIGFNPAKITPKSNGLGLGNIKSRIEVLKGTLTIESAESKGTSIIIQIPL